MNGYSQDWTDAPSKQNCKISVSTSELFYTAVEARREEELRRQKAEDTRKTSDKCILKMTLEQNSEIKYTAVRLEMKNDALSGPETFIGTRCSVILQI